MKKNKKIRAVPPGAAAEADEVAVEFIPCTLENIAEIKAAKRDGELHYTGTDERGVRWYKRYVPGKER